jgi:DNA replicative helicase MCM subunit Mcm2 (Cdc46/Mcm family)
MGQQLINITKTGSICSLPAQNLIIVAETQSVGTTIRQKTMSENMKICSLL